MKCYTVNSTEIENGITYDVPTSVEDGKKWGYLTMGIERKYSRITRVPVVPTEALDNINWRTLWNAIPRQDGNGKWYLFPISAESHHGAALVLFEDYAPLNHEARLRVSGTAKQIAKAQYRYGRHNRNGGYHPFLYVLEDGAHVLIRGSGKEPFFISVKFENETLSFEKLDHTKELNALWVEMDMPTPAQQRPDNEDEKELETVPAERAERGERRRR